MTFETLENLRFYIGNKTRLDRIAAENSRQNKYSEIALQHENQTALGEKLLKDLSREVCEVPCSNSAKPIL